jgi:small conductance mechanosensitive channel
MDGFLDWLETATHVYLIPLGIRILVAICIFMLGRIVARQLLKGLDRVMETSRIDESLRKFLHDIAYAVMLVAIVIAALDAVGVRTTAVIAVLGAAGLAVGLALQGSLSNFAAGVMLIVLRPYKVGDLVVIAKYLGRVEAIRVFHTIIITGDNREITIPNGQIITAPIENLTVLGRRRVDFVVSVIDAPDLAAVKRTLLDVLEADPRVHAPAPTIDVAEITESTVKLHVRPWINVESYTTFAAEAMERIRDAMAAKQLKFMVTVQAS